MNPDSTNFLSVYFLQAHPRPEGKWCTRQLMFPIRSKEQRQEAVWHGSSSIHMTKWEITRSVCGLRTHKVIGFLEGQLCPRPHKHRGLCVYWPTIEAGKQLISCQSAICRVPVCGNKHHSWFLCASLSDYTNEMNARFYDRVQAKQIRSRDTSTQASGTISSPLFHLYYSLILQLWLT